MELSILDRYEQRAAARRDRAVLHIIARIFFCVRWQKCDLRDGRNFRQLREARRDRQTQIAIGRTNPISAQGTGECYELDGPQRAPAV